MRRCAAAVVGLTLLAAVLRFWTVTSFAFKGDEYGTLRWIEAPVAEIMQSFGHQMTMHLYILALKAWSVVAGTSPLALKLPSLVAGILLVPVAWRLARTAGATVGLATVVLIAVHPGLIQTSRFARVYMILTLLYGISFLVYRSTLQHARGRHLVLLAVVNFLALAASLNGVCLFAMQGLHLVFQACTTRRWKNPARVAVALAVSAGLGAIFYGPAWPAIQDFRGSWASASLVRLDWVASTFQRQMGSMWTAWLGLMAVGAIALGRRTRGDVLMWLLWALGPWVYFVFARSTHPPTAFQRFVLPALPAQLFLCSAGAAAVIGLCTRERRGVAAVATGVALAALVVLAPSWSNKVAREKSRPYAAAFDWIRGNGHPDDLITRGLLGTERPQLTEADDSLPPFETTRPLTENKLDDSPGRLLLITQPLPGADEVWSRQFTSRPIAADDGRVELLVLIGKQGSAGGRPLRRTLRNYFRGCLASAETRPFSNDPVRHHQKLASVYRPLRRLAELEGDEEKEAEYAELFETHAALGREGKTSR